MPETLHIVSFKVTTLYILELSKMRHQTEIKKTGKHGWHMPETLHIESLKVKSQYILELSEKLDTRQK